MEESIDFHSLPEARPAPAKPSAISGARFRSLDALQPAQRPLDAAGSRHHTDTSHVAPCTPPMSVPRNVPVPSHSSPSPSRSSLRRTSGSHNPSARSLLPSPHLDDIPTDNGSRKSPPPDDSLRVSRSRHDAPGTALLQQQQPPPQHLVQPFFALIEDSTSHEHFHPTVHYIFADDDADIITEAALRSLQQTQPPDLEESAAGRSHAAAGAAAAVPSSTEEQEQEEAGPANRSLPRAKEGVKEHYIVLDIEPGTAAGSMPAPTASSVEGAAVAGSGSNNNTQNPSGFEVVNAYSMSADWQVLRTGISKAPRMAEGEDEEEGLMLRIEGRSGTPPECKVEGETMEEMIERFERGLEEVRLVMEASRRGGEVEVEVEADAGEAQGGSR